MNPLRVLGLWVLYAASGLVLAVAAAGQTADPGIDEAHPTPTRLRTKVLAGLSGLLLAVGTIGWFLSGDPAAGAPALARGMMRFGWTGGAVATVAAWVLIVRDLRADP